MYETLKNKVGDVPIAFYPAVEVTNPFSSPFYAKGVVVSGGALKVLDCLGNLQEVPKDNWRMVDALESRVDSIYKQRNTPII